MKYFAKRKVRFGQQIFQAGEEVTGVPEDRLASCGRFVESETVRKEREKEKKAAAAKKAADKGPAEKEAAAR